MSKNKSPQLFFILAALTLAGGTGATIYQYSAMNEKWDDLAALKKDTRDPKDIQRELDETTAQVTAAKTEIDHLERSVPAFAYVPTMLKELEAVGKQNGIEVLGVRPIPKADANKDKTGGKKRDPYQEIAIEVKGRGVFKSVQAFVTALEKFPKIVGLRSVSLQPKGEPGDPAARKLDATIELRAFLFPPEEGNGPGRRINPAPKAPGDSPVTPGAPTASAPQAGSEEAKPVDGSAVKADPSVAAKAVPVVAAAAKAPVKVTAKPAPRFAPKKTYKKSKRSWKRRVRR